MTYLTDIECTDMVFFPSHTFEIYRRRSKGNNRYGMSATLTAAHADIQPAGLERTQFVNGRFGATFTAFVDEDIDIKEGDQIVTTNGKRYSVKSVTEFDGAGLLSHKELIIVSQDGQDG